MASGQSTPSFDCSLIKCSAEPTSNDADDSNNQPGEQTTDISQLCGEWDSIAVRQNDGDVPKSGAR